LTERLKQYLDIAKRSGIVKGVIIDGSYVTDKDEPEDIDVIAVLTDEFDWTQELRPYQANVIDKAAIRRDYGFDAFVYQDGEAGLEKLIAVFGIVPEKYGELTAKTHKGMVRVLL
jgi:hypothetical protein